MTDKLAAELAPYGIDYVDAMDRFDDNAVFYKRLALKYFDDTHYVSLVAAMEAQDYDEGYKHAHALKGLAGNLSLKKLFQTSAVVSDALAQGEIFAAKEGMPAVDAAQAKALQGLEVLRDAA